MELSETFVVPCGFDDAWALLSEPVRYANCVPGAHLVGVDESGVQGVVNLRLGILTARLAGSAELDTDWDRRRITIRASGNGNQGIADAHITARLEPVSDRATEVIVDADVALQGRLAQLSSGIIAEVSGTLTEQFADNLAGLLANGHPVTVPWTRDASMPEPEALDLLEAARRPILKRLVPAVGLVLVVVLAVSWVRARPAVRGLGDR